MRTSFAFSYSVRPDVWIFHPKTTPSPRASHANWKVLVVMTLNYFPWVYVFFFSPLAASQGRNQSSPKKKRRVEPKWWNTQWRVRAIYKRGAVSTSLYRQTGAWLMCQLCAHSMPHVLRKTRSKGIPHHLVAEIHPATVLVRNISQLVGRRSAARQWSIAAHKVRPRSRRQNLR